MSPLTPPTAMSERRYDLDWIRVGAFMLLILYHVGMFYVPWDWHVKSPRPIDALEPLMLLLNPWRLTLLFVVSGCATRFLADGFFNRGKSAWALAGSRTLRLLPPLVFGMLVIVPPQSYYEVIEAARAAPALTVDNFWVRYVTMSGHWCDADGCLITPTWNHLWFIVYLLPYSLIVALIAAFPRVRNGLQIIADRAFKGWGLIFWPVLYLIVIRMVLAPRFEMTNAFYDDWYNHALSFGAFLFGYLTAKSQDVRQGLIGLRWPALILALSCWAAVAGYGWVHRDGAAASDALRTAIRIVYAVDQACFIAAIMGFGAKWLNRDAPALRYLTVGVFPFYIIHQTVIVVVGHHLAPLGLPQALEAVLLILSTATGCFVTYEIASRIGWFGLLLGVNPKPRDPAVFASGSPRSGVQLR